MLPTEHSTMKSGIQIGEGIMKRSLSILIVLFVTAITSGCILSKTPKTNDVQIPFGEQVTFSVNVFPTATYAWTLDGSPILNTDKSYVYTAETGEHILTVKAKQSLGTDTQRWNITVDPPIVGWFENFESYAVGSFPDTNGWSLLYNGAGSSQQYVTDTHAVSGSQSLHLVGSSCWTSSAYHPVDITPRVLFEASVFVNQIVNCGCTPQLARVSLYNPAIGAWGTAFGSISFNCDGKIYAIQSNYDRGQDILLMSYNPGTWYHVKLDVNLTDKTFDVYIDGVLLNSELQIIDSGMPTGVNLDSAHGENPTVWFDDVLLTPNP
jgi:hypothetical protein